jgi:hypothetical protein
VQFLLQPPVLGLERFQSSRHRSGGQGFELLLPVCNVCVAMPSSAAVCRADLPDNSQCSIVER